MPAGGFSLAETATQVMPTAATATLDSSGQRRATWTTATATEAIAGLSDGQDRHLLWRNRGGFLQALDAQFRQLSRFQLSQFN